MKVPKVAFDVTEKASVSGQAYKHDMLSALITAGSRAGSKNSKGCVLIASRLFIWSNFLPEVKEKESRLMSTLTQVPGPGLKVDPNSKYDDPKIKLQQRIEGWTLSLSILAAMAATAFICWRFPSTAWSAVAIAGLAGVIGGLLHSLKWFYRTVGNGEWDCDRVWWRYMNPLVSGVMGMSIYIIFRAGIAAKPSDGDLPGKEAFYAYSVGFLSGLFADNAMSKLRDIAYTLFGPTAPPATKPKP